MSREIISPEGLRQDGRRAREARRVACKIGVFSKVDGSAVYEQGLTKVVASVYGPRERRQFHGAEHDRALVTCEYNVSPFASSERKAHGKQDRLTAQYNICFGRYRSLVDSLLMQVTDGKEISLLIKQTFEACILTEKFPRSQISIFVQVLQNEGGAVAASINAVSLALINAGIPMKDFLCACSAGFVSGQPLLDLNQEERTMGSPQLYVAVYPLSDSVALLQMDSKMSTDHFESVLALAIQGAKQVYEVLKEEVTAHAQQILQVRGIVQS